MLYLDDITSEPTVPVNIVLEYGPAPPPGNSIFQIGFNGDRGIGVAKGGGVFSSISYVGL